MQCLQKWGSFICFLRFLPELPSVIHRMTSGMPSWILSHLLSSPLLSSRRLSSTASPPRSRLPQHPIGSYLRPHWKSPGAWPSLAIPFYTCLTGLGQQNLKKEEMPSGVQELSWPLLPGPDWALLGPSGGIRECPASKTFIFLPLPLWGN